MATGSSIAVPNRPTPDRALLAAEQQLQVARAVDDVNDFDTVGNDAKYDHIVADSSGPRSRSEIGTQAIYAWCEHNELRLIAKAIDEIFCVPFAVERNMAADFDRV